MTIEEQIKADCQRVLGARFMVDKIEQIWRPHHYVIADDAANWLTRHCYGIISPENMFTVERLLDARCAHPDCGKRFHEHEYRNILHMHLRMNVGYQYAAVRLKALEPVMKTNGLSGYKLTKSDYEILPRKVKL